MSTEQACPWCGKITYTHTNLAINSTTCTQCQRDVSVLPAASKVLAARRSIEENTIQLCINSGKINAIKYYRTEMNKLPGTNVSLFDAKETVEHMLRARRIDNLVRPPGRNGYVIALFLVALIIASIIYFFTHR